MTAEREKTMQEMLREEFCEECGNEIAYQAADCEVCGGADQAAAENTEAAEAAVTAEAQADDGAKGAVCEKCGEVHGDNPGPDEEFCFNKQTGIIEEYLL